MDTILITDKLRSLGINPNDIVLGDFDFIGEFTAKKLRAPSDKFYKSSAFFRPNYERGILIYYLILSGGITSYLEVGYGRGYSAICAAKAFYDMGIRESCVHTIDPQFENPEVRKSMSELSGVFSNELLSLIYCHSGKSEVVIPKLLEKQKKWDFVYIDGDHTAAGVSSDWNLLKDAYSKYLLFDDYHEPEDAHTDIDCARVIDEIPLSNDVAVEYIKMDRVLFPDERHLHRDSSKITMDPLERLKYGQVLLTRVDQVTGAPPGGSFTIPEDWNELTCIKWKCHH